LKAFRIGEGEQKETGMLAQVSLIPAESKKLISKAIAKMDVFQQALREGLIVLHPSSSTYFLFEEVTGQKPPTNVWVCGLIAPKGTCVEMAVMLEGPASFANVEKNAPRSARPNPETFPHCWVLRKGEFSHQEPLGVLLEKMGPDDVFVKGVNALDIEGRVGVLWGNLSEGGTATLVMAAQRRKGFHVIFPAGLEKLIPFSIKEVSKEAKRFEYDYSMGMPCGLLPCDGTVVTELRAIEILSGARAIPIAGGGLGGAEGAVTLVIKGDKEQVTQAIQYVEDSKGARLPPVRLSNCNECPLASTSCGFPLKDKPWV
jgi:hypothetical protein